MRFWSRDIFPVWIAYVYKSDHEHLYIQRNNPLGNPIQSCYQYILAWLNLTSTTCFLNINLIFWTHHIVHYKKMDKWLIEVVKNAFHRVQSSSKAYLGSSTLTFPVAVICHVLEVESYILFRFMSNSYRCRVIWTQNNVPSMIRNTIYTIESSMELWNQRWVSLAFT